jgi:RNA polymerase sigma factor (sigma-70 family)
MGSNRPADRSRAQTTALFATTHWSVVLAAGDSVSLNSREALEKLCRTYWYPLYAYARHRGSSLEDAEDQVQGFFAYLLERHLVSKAEPGIGRFRSFLLGCFGNYLANLDRHDYAVKRGGKQPRFSWNVTEAERYFNSDAVSTETPASLFERKWAMAVLGEAINRFEAEYRRQDKSELFERLHPFLEGVEEVPRYRQVAAELGLSESRVRVTVHRMRRRFQAVLRGVVAETVADLNEVDDELQHLIRVLRREREPPI